MKSLIWFLCIAGELVIYFLLQMLGLDGTIVRSLIIIGGVVLARYLCKEWDEKHNNDQK